MTNWELTIQTISSTTFINNALLVAFFVIFSVAFSKENKNEKSPVQWIDAIIDKKQNRISVSKLGQFFGIAVSTWVIITLSQNPAAYGIFPAVFAMWLAFLGGTWSYSQYVKTTQINKE